MKKVWLLLILVCLVMPSDTFADATVNEWIGEYNMNHDGWLGRLRIRDSKQDCASSKWCHLVLDYIKQDGTRYSGRIEVIDQKFQHMAFYINFPGNAQRFDAYLFSWDKNKMAGTTVWSGRRFGFFATK